MTGLRLALSQTLVLTCRRALPRVYTSRCQTANTSGQGCSLCSSRPFSDHKQGGPIAPLSGIDSMRAPKSSDATNEIVFMDDSEAHAGEFAADVPFSVDDVRASATFGPETGSGSVSSNRPKLPRSIKKLNRALGRKQTLEVPEHELIEQFVRGRGPGGQAINKTNSSVSLIHVPTGIRIQSQPTRSREQNRIAARHILSERLDELITRGLYTPTSSTHTPKEPSPIPTGKRAEEKALADAYTKAELRAAKERSRKLNRAKKQRKKKRLVEQSEGEKDQDGGS